MLELNTNKKSVNTDGVQENEPIGFTIYSQKYFSAFIIKGKKQLQRKILP